MCVFNRNQNTAFDSPNHTGILQKRQHAYMNSFLCDSIDDFQKILTLHWQWAQTLHPERLCLKESQRTSPHSLICVCFNLEKACRQQILSLCQDHTTEELLWNSSRGDLSLNVNYCCMVILCNTRNLGEDNQIYPNFMIGFLFIFFEVFLCTYFKLLSKCMK